MIDYLAAAEFHDVVRALAIIESGEDERAHGDEGLAFGLLQLHPPTFLRYYGCLKNRFQPHVLDSWTTAQIKACAAYLYAHKWGNASEEQRDLIITAWNLGEAAVFIEGKRNPSYVARWREAYARITV